MSKVKDFVSIILVFTLGIASGFLVKMLGEMLYERQLCLDDTAERGGVCQLERDDFMEYHYYWYPETHVEAQEDASTHEDKQDIMLDNASTLQGEFEPNNSN